MMVRKYYDLFKMRFTTGSFTTDWQRLEIGIAAGCTISVILFVLVMEMLLKACECEGAEMLTPLRSFMDDITVLSKCNKTNSWSRMRFKAKKSRSASLKRRIQKEVRFFIGVEPIPTVREKPVKSLGRLYEKSLSDRGQGKEIQQTAESGMKAIDNTSLPGKFKCWCLQFVLYARLLWPMMIYDLALTRIERIEQRCNVTSENGWGFRKCLQHQHSTEDYHHSSCQLLQSWKSSKRERYERS